MAGLRKSGNSRRPRKRDRRGLPDVRKRNRQRTYKNGYGRGGRRLPLAASQASLGVSQAMPEEIESCPHNSHNAAEYAHDIYRLLERREGQHSPRCDYMAKQPDLNATMRAILVDWLVAVAAEHGLKVETLFLTVNIMDRFLDRVTTAKQGLQLVGITAMKIAGKFEEHTGICTAALVHSAGGAVTRDDIHGMEVRVLTELDFAICVPTAAHFMRRFQRLNQCPDDSAHGHLLQYLLELTLMDSQMTRYEPSRLVAAATLLSNKLMKQQPSWPPRVASHCNFDLPAVKACAQEMCSIFEAAATSPLQAVRRKFSHLVAAQGCEPWR